MAMANIILKTYCVILIIMLAKAAVPGREKPEIRDAGLFIKSTSRSELHGRRRQRDVGSFPMNTSAAYVFGEYVLDTEAPQESVKRFCPLSTQCATETVSSGLKEYESRCCVPCDCTESCVAMGTCCMGVKTVKENPENITTDLTEFCVATYVGETDIGLREIDSYWLIKSCPRQVIQNSEYDITEKCIRPSENALEEMIPVYSNATNRNYGNVYCAMCNNDSINIIPWASNFSCRQFKMQTSLFPNGVGRKNDIPLLQSIRRSKGCILKWKPIFGEVSHCIDQDKVISNCLNSTLDTTKIEDLCRDIYSPVKGEFGLYKNVFCLLCNEGQSVFGDLCRKTFGFSEISRSTPIFSTLLAADAYIVKPALIRKSDVTECHGGLTYDNALNNCLQKSCPISHVAVANSCIPMMKKVTGVSFDYRIKLLYSWDSFVLKRPEDIFFEVRHLVLNKDTSKICEEKILKIEPEGEQMVVRVQLTKRLGKGLHDIQEDFEMFNEKVKRMKNHDTIDGHGYTVEMDNAPFQPIVSGYVNYAVYSDFAGTKACGSSIAVSNMQICNTVLVREFNEQEGGNLVINNKSFLTGEYILAVDRERNEERSVYICYELYVERMGTSTPVTNRFLSINARMNSEAGMRRSFIVLSSCLLTISRLLRFV